VCRAGPRVRAEVEKRAIGQGGLDTRSSPTSDGEKVPCVGPDLASGPSVSAQSSRKMCKECTKAACQAWGGIAAVGANIDKRYQTNT